MLASLWTRNLANRYSSNIFNNKATLITEWNLKPSPNRAVDLNEIYCLPLLHHNQWYMAREAPRALGILTLSRLSGAATRSHWSSRKTGRGCTPLGLAPNPYCDQTGVCSDCSSHMTSSEPVAREVCVCPENDVVLWVDTFASILGCVC